MTEVTVFIEYTSSASQSRQSFGAGNLQRCQETFLAIKGFLNKEMPFVKVLRAAFQGPETPAQSSQNIPHIEPFEVYVSDQLVFSRKKSAKWPNILIITSQIKKIIQEKISMLPLIHASLPTVNDEANGNNLRIARLPILKTNSNHRTVLKINKRKTKKLDDSHNKTTITENSSQLFTEHVSEANIPSSENQTPKPEPPLRSKSPLERRRLKTPSDEKSKADQSVEKENLKHEGRLKPSNLVKQKVIIERKHRHLDHKSNVGDVSLMQVKERILQRTNSKKKEVDEMNQTNKSWAKDSNTFQKFYDKIQGKDTQKVKSTSTNKVLIRKKFKYKTDNGIFHRSNSITITHFQEETSEAISYKFLGDRDDDIKILQTPSLLGLALDKHKKELSGETQLNLTRSRSLEYDEPSSRKNQEDLFNFHQSFSPIFAKDQSPPPVAENSKFDTDTNPFRLSSGFQEEIRQTAEFGTSRPSHSMINFDQKLEGKVHQQPKRIKKINKKAHLELSESALSTPKQDEKVKDDDLKQLETETRMIASEHIPKEFNLTDKSFQFINSSRDLKENRFTPQFATYQTSYY